MPDTPHYHISKGDRHRATKSLQYLRGMSANGISAELDEIQESVVESMSHRAGFIDVFKGRANLIGRNFSSLSTLITEATLHCSFNYRCWTYLLPKLLRNRRCAVL